MLISVDFLKSMYGYAMDSRTRANMNTYWVKVIQPISYEFGAHPRIQRRINFKIGTFETISSTRTSHNIELKMQLLDSAVC